MWGIIPAAGLGSRIQPLAFSKELLPVGSRFDGGVERPRAVSEYLVDRMITAGADKICFVIAPGKADIVNYFGNRVQRAAFTYVVQPHPSGLCDALFQSAHLIDGRDRVVVGLPDTVWFPEDGLAHLPADKLSFLLFPVDRPERFDAVVIDDYGAVQEVQVKRARPDTHWVWGAFGMPGEVFHRLHGLWNRRGRDDEYFGTLVNAFLAEGGAAAGIPLGQSYVDVGTIDGYREALHMLNERTVVPAAS